MSRAKKQPELAPAPAEPKLRDTVRVLKIAVDRVVSPGGGWTEVTKRWHETADACRRCANLLYETWLCHHVQNNSAAKLRAWLDARGTVGERVKAECAAQGITDKKQITELTRTAKKELGKCPVEAFPPELTKKVAAWFMAEFPHLHVRCGGLLLQCLQSDLVTKKATNGSLNKWIAILLRNEAIPSFTGTFPIRFDAHNCSVHFEDKTPYIDLNIWRVPRPGKKTATSIKDRVYLSVKHKKDKRAALLMQKVVSGEWAFRGSTLEYNRKLRKWFVVVCYRLPVQTEQLDPGKRAVLIPGRNRPFIMRFRDGSGSRALWHKLHPNAIDSIRTRIFSQRRDREANYRTSTMRRGHGRKSIDGWRTRFGQKWREFVRRVNHNVSHWAVEECAARGIGELVVLVPEGEAVANRRLCRGDGRSSWEFFELTNKLKYKGMVRGVEIKVIKCGGGKKLDTDE